jgi:predicted aconitase with swiveling domain
MAVVRISGRALVDGAAEGRALVTDTPLSFWGGVDPVDGRVIDKRHPLDGACITGRILVLPCGRGSCSASGVLLECISNGTAPAGVVVSETDPIIGLGAILGEELLGRVVPAVLVSSDDRARISANAWVRIGRGGLIEVHPDCDGFATESRCTSISTDKKLSAESQRALPCGTAAAGDFSTSSK